MEIKHQIRCSGSDVLVCEDGRSYQLTIQALTNPLGFGQALGTFDTLEEAIEGAEHFCLVYRIAKEHGYYLKNDELVRHEGKPIAVQWLLERRFTEQEWCELIASRAAAV
ncbi:hypothetical protein [Paenibacillus ginsengarvi]|jgi:hypothetical protein|uniref:Uncharacterized protein n=1 Tax=Paenibacillus ginsengarvi TaxID=400777 RepID=A0A3B0BG39_9BACL|nr:hypothetical protein [Paenibacillus ginsengarvi]RKN71258.1 hypothetical protein D7M11_29635 [Paenibacillus ginsengarvi]